MSEPTGKHQIIPGESPLSQGLHFGRFSGRSFQMIMSLLYSELRKLEALVL